LWLTPYTLHRRRKNITKKISENVLAPRLNVDKELFFVATQGFKFMPVLFSYFLPCPLSLRCNQVWRILGVFITISNESLHEISNDNGVRVVYLVTSKNLIVRSTMFPRRNIHKLTWASPDRKTHIKIDDILTDRRRHSNRTRCPIFQGSTF
jgi:hypothetical protein